MRLTIVALAANIAAPTFAQEAIAPPPEGFYRNIEGAYDLLLRLPAYSDIQLVRAPAADQSVEQLADDTSKPAIDWTRPVIGVDPTLAPNTQDEPLPIEVIERKNVEASPAAREFIDSLSTKSPPRWECKPADRACPAR